MKRTYTIGVIAEEIGDAYGAMVISEIEEYLRKNNYFFLTVIHRHDPELLQTYAQMVLTRGVEGFITTDTSLNEKVALPAVAISGHRHVEGVTNIVLDHKRAARLASSILKSLGHEEIAFIRGQPVSSDSADRWNAICGAAVRRLTNYQNIEKLADEPVSRILSSAPFAKRKARLGDHSSRSRFAP